MVSESPGRNASEREVAPKDPNPGGRAVDYPVKATRADAVWLTRRRAPDRVDLEIPLGDPEELTSFLEGRFGVTWPLVRRRQTYAGADGPEVVVDYLTQVGTFAELEGASSALEALANQLRGLGMQEVRNYKEIILEWCGLAGLAIEDVYGLDERGPLVRSYQSKTGDDQA